MRVTSELLRMLVTYRPREQAVVSVAIGKANPITVKMRLDRPAVVDEAKGIH